MRKKLIRCASVFLALILCFGCLFTVVPAHAFVLDPVAWLYPVWVAYGQQAGVTISTMGGDEFTQTGFTGLFNEWQQFEVSSGNQGVAQTIADFVTSVSDFVSIVAGAVSGGTLWSKLRLASGITDQLARFWNWVIVDKLGGSSVDATDFDQTSGNLVLASSALFLPDNNLLYGFSNQYPYWASYIGVSATYSIFPQVALFSVGNRYYGVSDVDTILGIAMAKDSSLVIAYPVSSWSREFDCGIETLDSSTGLYYGQGSMIISSDNRLPSYPDLRSALDAISSSFNSSSSGSITVAPDLGVDVLGFPDVSDPEYVPTDTNIDWNIPYDGTLDVPGYLDTAYDMSLDGTLTDTEVTEAPPVSGSGTVGNVGEYVAPGLGSVFPFCIPFDIYNFLSALAADPEAPCFTATLAFPQAIGGAQTIELDLDNPTFNQLASLLRLLELLAFCVGLAFVTRSMFIRG